MDVYNGSADNVLQTAGVFGADDIVGKPREPQTSITSINVCIAGRKDRTTFRP